MNPVDRIREAKEILESLLAKRTSSVLLVRAHRLLETALDQLFQDPEDVAGLDDGDLLELDLDVDQPFPPLDPLTLASVRPARPHPTEEL
jgi:hypothetical protein